jgi:peptide/nickel transport system substrate-binding protein
MLAVCAALLASAAQAQTANKIVVAETFTPRSAFALETDDSFVLTRAGCLETLTRIDFDGTLHPALATMWKQTSPTTWEFTLRDNVKFQDGEPFTAEAVASALNNVLKATAPARAFSPKVVSAVEAVGANVVRVTTPSPSVLLPLRLASPSTGILSSKGYVDGKINPVGTCTGPFTITEETPQQGLTLKRNDAYWGTKAKVAAAEVRYIPDGNVRATQVRTGEAQIALNVPVAARKALANAAGVKLMTLETPRTTALYFNNKKAPLDNMKVRQAIQAALDLPAIVAAIYEGAGQPASGPFGPKEPWSPKGKPVAHDVAKAKKLLEEAGIKPGTLKLGLFAYVERPEFKDLAAVIQEQLKAIGITVDIRVANYAALEPDLLSGNFDMTLLSRGHLVDVADPIGFLQADYTCTGTYNLSHYCNPQVDEMLKAAAAEPSAEKRYAVYRQVAQKLQDDAVDAFILFEQAAEAVSTKVHGYQMHPLQYYALTPQLTLN